MEKLDFRGMNCPVPVMETRKYLDSQKGIEKVCVTVDNSAASENVSRYLASRGFQTEIHPIGNDYQVFGSSTGDDCKCEIMDTADFEKTTLVMITNNTIGSGSRELGEKLMVSFINTLSEIKDSLWRLVFLNEGVKLTVEGSSTYHALAELGNNGVSILVCGTCLEYFGLSDRKKAGLTTNMLDIMTSLQVASRVVNI